MVQPGEYLAGSIRGRTRHETTHRVVDADRSSHHPGPGLRSQPRSKEQWRTKDLEARRKSIYDIQQNAAEQQYYVHLHGPMVTQSWALYVKNHGANIAFDYGSRAVALWLDR